MPGCELPILTARVVSKIHKRKRKSLEFAKFRVNVLRLRFCFSLWTLPFNSIGARFCVYVAFAFTFHCEWALTVCHFRKMFRSLLCLRASSSVCVFFCRFWSWSASPGNTWCTLTRIWNCPGLKQKLWGTPTWRQTRTGWGRISLRPSSGPNWNKQAFVNKRLL